MTQPVLKFKIKGSYIQRTTIPDQLKAGKWIYKTEEREVVLMAISGKYAMVRRKGCYPYVCDTKELKDIVAAAD